MEPQGAGQGRTGHQGGAAGAGQGREGQQAGEGGGMLQPLLESHRSRGHSQQSPAEVQSRRLAAVQRSQQRQHSSSSGSSPPACSCRGPPRLRRAACTPCRTLPSSPAPCAALQQPTQPVSQSASQPQFGTIGMTQENQSTAPPESAPDISCGLPLPASQPWRPHPPTRV